MCGDPRKLRISCILRVSRPCNGPLTMSIAGRPDDNPPSLAHLRLLNKVVHLHLNPLYHYVLVRRENGE